MRRFRLTVMQLDGDRSYSEPVIVPDFFRIVPFDGVFRRWFVKVQMTDEELLIDHPDPRSFVVQRKFFFLTLTSPVKSRDGVNKNLYFLNVRYLHFLVDLRG